MTTEVVYRQLERDGYCRICEEIIERKKDWVVSWYSSCNRGTHIHICPKCVREIYELLP